jgi:hypothetical protein
LLVLIGISLVVILISIVWSFLGWAIAWLPKAKELKKIGLKTIRPIRWIIFSWRTTTKRANLKNLALRGPIVSLKILS